LEKFLFKISTSEILTNFLNKRIKIYKKKKKNFYYFFELF
jgi:hypothetical protein